MTQIRMPIGSRSPTSWLEPAGADGVISRLNAALEGRYAIERELGEGGMATVYLATDLKHERPQRPGALLREQRL